MEQNSRKEKAGRSRDESFNLDALLHPAQAFAHPVDVVRDNDLTLNEKRAILASWASGACAVGAAPELRVNTTGRSCAGMRLWTRSGCLIEKTRLSLRVCTRAGHGDCTDGEHAQAANPIRTRRQGYEEGEGNFAGMQRRTRVGAGASAGERQ